MSAAKLFGYTIHEMLNAHVQKFMPEVYAHKHQKILLKAVTNEEVEISTRERFVCGKHR
jgi:PAS domain S-box-containing protein